MAEADIKANCMIIRDVLNDPAKRRDEDLALLAACGLTLLECLLTDINRIAEAATFMALETQRVNSK